MEEDDILDKRSGEPRSGDEPPAEGIPAELAPGGVPRRGDLFAAAVDGIEGVPAAGAADRGRAAGELAPVHEHADACGAALVCERRGVGEDAEEGGDEDAEGEVVERLEGDYLDNNNNNNNNNNNK